MIRLKFFYPAFFLLLTACQKDPVPPTPPIQPVLTEHLTLGNPSGATPDAAQPTNYLLSNPSTP